ncbi:hypothetical protein BC939DRAFT_501370 [Gamsiella multidivaricata]|uniref:uncharacterized protein n=1 Tax=Gamsiella multidivaricata TaxID=101098 RepID=UPI00221F9099|nr:uncharacterized protein BC939DRAFT_501370 [Gamsiella multidivaricata]KAG0362001.1 hypothetical protein BGZ54_008828 [Gamsiella multidivaricata]KAI7827028.1 hypothetical protein BC939DRAFT_501370 [Gamsiella multidivaricata]
MHAQSSTVAVVILSTLTLLSHLTAVTKAHSWADCVDWKFNNPSNPGWGDNDGVCQGYCRRFPMGHAFGTLDSDDPSRHYQQDHANPDTAPPCADGRHGKDVGADETLANPPEDGYGGDWGPMTHTRVGDRLCVRWPAKNHAESNEDNTMVQINLSKNKDGQDPTQQELLRNTIAVLPYKNCGRASSTDKRPCGGCFEVPVRASGRYLLQWRWALNPGEWYTSCADIQIGGDKGDD